MLSDFLSELRRRRVVRVLVTYAVAAWLVIQVTTSVFPILGLPDWSIKLVVIVMILGFPVVIALGWAFDITESGVERTPLAGGHRIPRAVRIGAIGVVVVVAATAAWLATDSAADEPLDPALVAVFPFRFSGTDASLRGMAEGMVDLLRIKLEGDGGPRAADPRAVIAAWRKAGGDAGDVVHEDMLEIARRFGSARLLTGEVVSAGRNVVLNATLTHVRSGRSVSADVEGAADSLTWLVERLTRELLSRDAGEHEDRLASLTTASLPALKHYLNGQSQYRRSHYRAARDAYLSALAEDSTFTLAALGLEQVALWADGVPTAAQRRNARRTAWNRRDKLSPVDRSILFALLGQNYPALPTQAEMCRGWNAARSLAPDRSEVTYWVADCVYHLGHAFGTPDPMQRARKLFQASFDADSSFVPNVEHLIEIAAALRDTAELRRLVAFYIATDSAADRRFASEWFLAYLRADSARMRALQSQFATHPHAYEVARFHRDNHIGVEWMDVVLRARPLSTPGAGLVSQLEIRFYNAMMQGRQREALDIAARMDSAEGGTRGARWILQAGTYSELDSTHVQQAARTLEVATPATVPDSSAPGRRASYYYNSCALTQYRLWRRDTRDARRVIDNLAAASPSIGVVPSNVAITQACATILRALYAYATNAPDLRQHALRVDSLIAEQPQIDNLMYNGRHVAARLLEATGEHAAALRALQRREYMTGQERYTEMRHRESGRIAERLGDFERARNEYQLYLDLRVSEDEYGRRASQSIRDALARLAGEASRRR